MARTAARRRIGSGASAVVYRIDEGRVEKVFEPGLGDVLADREFHFARQAFDAGIPTPQPLELDVRTDRCAIVFALCQGTTLDVHTLPRPWRYRAASEDMAALHAHIHAVDTAAAADPIPEGHRQQDFLRQLIGYATQLPTALQDHCMAAWPRDCGTQRLCHGDFSPSNVMIERGRCLAIDWSLASWGDPAADVAMTWLGIRELPESLGMPWPVRFALRLGSDAYRQHIQALAPDTTPDRVNAWLAPVAAARFGAIEKSGGDEAALMALARVIRTVCESD